MNMFIDEAAPFTTQEIETLRRMSSGLTMPSTRFAHGGLISTPAHDLGYFYKNYVQEFKRLTDKKQVLKYLPDAYRKTERVGNTIVHRVYSSKEDPILIGEGKTKPRAWHSAAGCKLIKVMKKIEESIKPPRDKMAEMRAMYGGGTVTGRFSSGGLVPQSVDKELIHKLTESMKHIGGELIEKAVKC